MEITVFGSKTRVFGVLLEYILEYQEFEHAVG